MSVQIPLQGLHWFFSVLPFLGHLYGGKRIQISGHSSFGSINSVGRLPFWLEFKRILRRLLVQRIQIAWRSHPELSWPTLLMQTNHVPQLPHNNQNRLSVQKLGVPHDLCYLGVRSNSEFLRWRKSIDVEKWAVPSLFFVPFRWPSFLALAFRHLPCQHFLELLSLFANRALHIRNFRCLGIGLCTTFEKKTMNCSLSATRSSWSLGWIVPVRVLVDSWDSTTKTYLDFRELPCLTRHRGNFAGQGGLKSNFVRSISHGALELTSSRSTSQIPLNREHCRAPAFQKAHAVFLSVGTLWTNLT